MPMKNDTVRQRQTGRSTKMNKTRLFLIIWGAANALVQEFAMAMMDKVLTGPEFLRMIKSALMSLRFAGLSSTELDKIQLVTTASEWQSIPFKDGDGAIFAPQELIDQIKINLDTL
jgi:hypothetical protein